MTVQIRILLIILSLVLIIMGKHGAAKLIELIGQWFIYSIATCLVYIAIRGK